MSVTVQTPTAGTLPILGAVVAGTLEGGVFTPISGGGGSGVVNGQILRDNAGAVFLNAGTHLITSDNWTINEDGSVSLAGGVVVIDPDGNINSNGGTTVIGINGTVSFWSGDTVINGSGVTTTAVLSALGNFGIESNGVASFTGITSTRITQRVATLTDAATITPNSDSYDGGILTELSQDSTIANPTGTPTDQQRYLLRIKSTTSRALTWDTAYGGSTGIPLATATTGGGKVDYFVLIRDVADSKWHVMPNTGF